MFKNKVFYVFYCYFAVLFELLLLNTATIQLLLLNTTIITYYLISRKQVYNAMYSKSLNIHYKWGYVM